MLGLGIIRESNSPFASPIVIVKKNDGLGRICVDYLKLNKLTVADPQLMATAEDLFQRLEKINIVPRSISVKDTSKSQLLKKTLQRQRL